VQSQFESGAELRRRDEHRAAAEVRHFWQPVDDFRFRSLLKLGASERDW